MSIVNLVLAHPLESAAIGTYLFTAIVDTMPAPGSNKPAHELLYQWAFDALHVALNKVGPIVERKLSAKLGGSLNLGGSSQPSNPIPQEEKK